MTGEAGEALLWFQSSANTESHHCLDEEAALLCKMKGRKWSSGTLCPSVLLWIKKGGAEAVVPGLCISPAWVVEKEGCQGARVRCTRCSSFGEALDVCSVTGSPFAFEEIFLIL